MLDINWYYSILNKKFTSRQDLSNFRRSKFSEIVVLPRNNIFRRYVYIWLLAWQKITPSEGFSTGRNASTCTCTKYIPNMYKWRQVKAVEASEGFSTYRLWCTRPLDSVMYFDCYTLLKKWSKSEFQSNLYFQLSMKTELWIQFWLISFFKIENTRSHIF